MPRSRPTSNPISYHKWTKQFYVTRAGRRIYLGSDKEQALKKYHRLGLGFELIQQEAAPPVQQANWWSPKDTLKRYKGWVGRFIENHSRLKVADFKKRTGGRIMNLMTSDEYKPCKKAILKAYENHATTYGQTRPPQRSSARCSKGFDSIIAHSSKAFQQ